MNEVSVKAFVQRLLDDWRGDEWQIAGEFCVSADENKAVDRGIEERFAEWAEIAASSDLVDAIEAKIGPLSGDQILVLRGEFNEEIVAHLLQELIHGLRERGERGPAAAHLPLILALANGQSIETLDEDEMRAHGWIRAERVFGTP